MKTIDQLEKQLEKENQLIEKHKRNAADIKKQIEQQKGNLTIKAVNSLNLTGTELKLFLNLLKDKKTVMEAASLFTEDSQQEEEPLMEERNVTKEALE